jgi:hypothetical protein
MAKQAKLVPRGNRRRDDPPPAQRSMSERAGSTVEEAAGSHAIYVSQPAAVAALIEKAASEVSSAAR